METFSALLALCVGNSQVTGEFPSQKPVTRSFMFCLICAWMNGWVNNREASYLRWHNTRYAMKTQVKYVMGGSDSKPLFQLTLVIVNLGTLLLTLINFVISMDK